MRKLKQLLNHKILLLGVLLVGMAITTLVVLRSSSSANTSSDKSSAATTPPPAFSFDASKATGWRQGPANEISLVAFKNGSDCFISTDIRNDAVTEAQVLDKTRSDLTSYGYTVTDAGTMATAFSRGGAADVLQYTLHQYAISGSGNPDEVYKMQVFGYVPLDQKHIRVQAYCANETPLSEIHDVLSAITLSEEY